MYDPSPFNTLHQKRSLHFLYIIPLIGLLAVIFFQNCRPDNQNPIPPGPASPESLSYDRGSIIPTNSSGEEFPEDQTLPINTDIQLKFLHSHPA